MVRIALVAGLIGCLIACGDESCDEYVDYMCECHADDPEFDCEEIRRTYSSDDPDTLDQCQIDLADQRDEDADNELDCDL